MGFILTPLPEFHTSCSRRWGSPQYLYSRSCMLGSMCHQVGTLWVKPRHPVIQVLKIQDIYRVNLHLQRSEQLLNFTVQQILSYSGYGR